jgi:hypothetical protein
MVHEGVYQVLQKLLDLDQDGKKRTSTSHATAIAHWLALWASQRELLPIVEPGTFLNMDGFDWVDDNMIPIQFVGAVLYGAWIQVLSDA